MNSTYTMAASSGVQDGYISKQRIKGVIHADAQESSAKGHVLNIYSILYIYNIYMCWNKGFWCVTLINLLDTISKLLEMFPISSS